MTYKVVAYPVVEQLDSDECIDWAIEMVELGYETPYLLMLSSITKPANFFETIEYVKASLYELGLKEKVGEAGILSYSSYYILQIADRINVKDNLTEVYKFCLARDYEDRVYDFYLLYFAWDQLHYDPNGVNHYWDGVTVSTIEDTIVSEARKWLEEYKEDYTQQAI